MTNEQAATRDYHIHAVIGAVYGGQKPPGKARFVSALDDVLPMLSLTLEAALLSGSRTPQLTLLHIQATTSRHDAKDAALELLEHLCTEAEGGNNALRCLYAAVHWDGDEAVEEIGGSQVDAHGAMPL